MCFKLLGRKVAFQSILSADGRVTYSLHSLFIHMSFTNAYAMICVASKANGTTTLFEVV